MPLRPRRDDECAERKHSKPISVSAGYTGRQARARAEGKRFGRKPVLDGEQRQKALQRLADGASISAVAREMKASRATTMRVGRAGSGRPPLMRSLGALAGQTTAGHRLEVQKRRREDMTS